MGRPRMPAEYFRGWTPAPLLTERDEKRLEEISKSGLLRQALAIFRRWRKA
jgi:hypothetical protein